ncbi:MAG: HRDC domain-containing protein, partial [Bryobacteraceae bacterium]
NRDLAEHLRGWRRETARRESVPGFVILHDSTLEDLCRLRPRTLAELLAVRGVGERKIQRYGRQILDALAAFGQ